MNGDFTSHTPTRDYEADDKDVLSFKDAFEQCSRRLILDYAHV